MADDRTYIRVHDGVYEHPKVVGLSDGAFRLLVESWCYCSRNLTDGRITDAAWRRFGTPRSRRELVDSGLVDEHDDGGVEMHDYLEHQRSAEEVAAYKAKKKAAGAKGNHTKHHVEKGRVDPECEWCQSPDGSHKGSQVRPQVRPQTARKDLASTETETDFSTYEYEGAHLSNANGSQPPLPDRCSRHAHTAEPGNCGNCADVRKANAAKPRAALSLVADERLPWCGRCSEFTRQLETPVGVMRCPECHPLAEEAS